MQLNESGYERGAKSIDASRSEDSGSEGSSKDRRASVYDYETRVSDYFTIAAGKRADWTQAPPGWEPEAWPRTVV